MIARYPPARAGVGLRCCFDCGPGAEFRIKAGGVVARHRVGGDQAKGQGDGGGKAGSGHLCGATGAGGIFGQICAVGRR